MIESPTLALADFATKTRTEDIPSRVRDKVRILCLDAIGCAAASVKKAPIADFVSAIKKMDDGHLGSIWGFGLKASLPNVAMANGTMIHFLEMDDVHKASLMHPLAIKTWRIIRDGVCLPFTTITALLKVQ